MALLKFSGLIGSLVAVQLVCNIGRVLAHGKMLAPMGMNVDPNLAVSSQSDVSIGTTALSPCGTTLGKPFDRSDTTPRAQYYPGQSATLTWHTVNQDGAGPLRVRFSPDNGATWQDADIQSNVPGALGLDAAGLPIIGSDADHQLQFTVPNMECPPGQCMMLVSNPLTFGSCAPVSIQQGASGNLTMTHKSTGGASDGSGAKGIMAGGIGGVLDALNL